jgi:hypothetical protein
VFRLQLVKEFVKCSVSSLVAALLFRLFCVQQLLYISHNDCVFFYLEFPIKLSVTSPQSQFAFVNLPYSKFQKVELYLLLHPLRSIYWPHVKCVKGLKLLKNFAWFTVGLNLCCRKVEPTHICWPEVWLFL